MILLNMYIPKKTLSQERADRLQAEKDMIEAKKDKLTNGSLCCKATIRTVYNKFAMENEVRTIRVCNGCNCEAPDINMFTNWDKLPQLFIELNAHKTNNNLK